MTVEEIKKQLEELIKDRESFMVGDYDKDIYGRDKEALAFAVKAVEKQIPKKVRREFKSIDKAITCFEVELCPRCGKNIYDDEVEVSYYEYCPECGQALDWSENNAEIY